MRELENSELENLYGGGILAGIGVAITAIVAIIASYKMLSASEASVKLPGGTSMSFSGAKGANSERQETKSISQPKAKSKAITLNQLDNAQKSFSSTPRNFLVKI